MSTAKISKEILWILDKKIHKIVGRREGNRFIAIAILLDDKETYIELEEQDDCYHDCSIIARILRVRKEGPGWNYLEKLPGATDLT